jgi:hypothetical protein
MNKITFNTGRAMSREGQIVTVAEHGDGTVLFHDHTLKRAGRILATFDRRAGMTLREFTMRHYDDGGYVPDANALKLVRQTVPVGQFEFISSDERASREELSGERFEHDGTPIKFDGEPFVHGAVHYIVNYHVVGQPSYQYTDLVVDSDSPLHAMMTVVLDKKKQGANVQVIFIEPTYRRDMTDYSPVADALRAGPGWFVGPEGDLNPATFQPHR